jgi:hypothetical protein
MIMRLGVSMTQHAPPQPRQGQAGSTDGTIDGTIDDLFIYY